MGNIDRREYLHPHAFGDDEPIFSSSGVMAGLQMLLTPTGALPEDKAADPIGGRWSTQRITIVTDYDDAGIDLDSSGADSAYLKLMAQEDGWVDISEHVLTALVDEFDVFEVRLRAMKHPWHQGFPRSILHLDGTIEAIL